MLSKVDIWINSFKKLYKDVHGTSTMVLIIKITWYFLCKAWNLVTSFSNNIYDRDCFTIFSYLIAFWLDFS